MVQPVHPNNTDLDWDFYKALAYKLTMTKVLWLSRTQHHLKTLKSSENLEADAKCEDFVKKLMLTNRENTLNCHFSFTSDFLGNFDLLKKVAVEVW